MRLYDNFLMEFQERIDIYGREKLSLKVDELQKLREKLKLVCDVREYNSKTLLKTETKKYSYSVPFNRNVIHYISGLVKIHLYELFSKAILFCCNELVHLLSCS